MAQVTQAPTDPAFLARLKASAYLPPDPDFSRFESLIPGEGSH